ncbi:MAG: hypothetical protein ACK56F_06550, partial [bacterium]
ALESAKVSEPSHLLLREQLFLALSLLLHDHKASLPPALDKVVLSLNAYPSPLEYLRGRQPRMRVI